VWVRRVQPAKIGEELSAFQLQIVWEAAGLQESFLEFDLGLVVVVQQENDVRKPLEVGIDCAVKRQLGVARIEAALLRVVVADLDVIEIGGAGIG
jgi:hypothetical protein